MRIYNERSSLQAINALTFTQVKGFISINKQLFGPQCFLPHVTLLLSEYIYKTIFFAGIGGW